MFMFMERDREKGVNFDDGEKTVFVESGRSEMKNKRFYKSIMVKVVVLVCVGVMILSCVGG